MSKVKNALDLGAVIRAAFAESGLSRFELSRRAGVPYAGVHRFIGGLRDVQLSTASKLCDALGLELRPARRRKGRE